MANKRPKFLLQTFRKHCVANLFNDLFSSLPENEPSTTTGFSGNRLERMSENRDADSLSGAMNDPRVLAYAIHLSAGPPAAYLKADGDKRKPLFTLDELSELKPDIDNAVLLGFDPEADHAPRIGVSCRLSPEVFEGDDYNHLRLTLLRTLTITGQVPNDAMGAMAQAASLLSWNHTHQFCARCGAASEATDGGYKRICTQCGAMHFPRTDPVVIMMVVDGDRCLLGRSPHFPGNMYSTLAGFVEPGETIENAVRREIKEESQIDVGRVRYHASQPWPMPHTLMIGCYAEAKSTEITIDPNELDDCRWFTRTELQQILAGEHAGGVECPPPSSIACRLMTAWAHE